MTGAIVSLLTFFSLVFVAAIQGNPSSIKPPKASVVFDAGGDLLYIQKDSEGNIYLETDQTPISALIKGPLLTGQAHSLLLRKDKSGRVWMIWEERDSDNSRIYLGWLQDGQILSPRAVCFKEGFNFLPDLSFDNHDSPWMTWVNDQNRKQKICVQEINTGKYWEVSSPSFSSVTTPRIIIDHKGCIWVFWSGKRGEERGLYYRVFNQLVWTSEERIDQGNNFPHIHPDVALDARGIIWLVWSGYDGSDYEIYCSAVDDTGAHETIKITDNDSESDIFPSVSIVRGQIPLIVWEQAGPAENQIYLTYLEQKTWNEKRKISLEGHQNRWPELTVEGDRIGMIWQTGGNIETEVIHFFQLTGRSPLFAAASPSLWIPAAELDEDKFIGFGDSITYGTFSYGPDPDKGYIPRLENLLNLYERRKKVVNAGKGGELTIEGLVRIEQVMNYHLARYLLLMEGTNDVDIDLGLLIDDIVFNLEQMLKRCFDHAVFPFIASIIPQKGWAWEAQKDRIYQLNEKILPLAQELSVPFVDQFYAFFNYTDAEGGYEKLLSDLVHPNEKGYQLMAQKWYEEICNSLPSVLNFKGKKVLNRSLLQAEYINVLTWEKSPRLHDITKYRIYKIEGGNRKYLAELNAATSKYMHRKVNKNARYVYALVAVNNEGREEYPAFAEVQ